MRGFELVADGWQSLLTVWEREYLAGLLEQVSAVLAAEGPLETTRSGAGAQRAHESQADAAVLAALDFDTDPADLDGAGFASADGARPEAGPSDSGRGDPDSAREGSDGGQGADNDPGPRAGQPVRLSADVVSLLEILLPEASEDPRVAVEVSSMTRRRLRALKHSRLTDVVRELREPTGADGAVLVRRGHEGDWLAAVNDVRLVLAHRLGIEDPASAQGVHDLAWAPAPEDEPDEARVHRGLAITYDMLTWWQESLLAVVLAGQGPA